MALRQGDEQDDLQELTFTKMSPERSEQITFKTLSVYESKQRWTQFS